MRETAAEPVKVQGQMPDWDKGKGKDHPAYNISHDECAEFCRKLSEQLRTSGVLPDGWQVNLPTEA